MSDISQHDPSRWPEVTGTGPFVRHIGPICSFPGDLPAGEPVRFGFLVEGHHCNPYETCHGGMLASFVDFCMFRGYLAAMPELTGSPTLTMSIDYFSGAKLGEWVESRVDISARTGKTIFVTCTLVVGERSVLRGTGIYPAWRKDGVRK